MVKVEKKYTFFYPHAFHSQVKNRTRKQETWGRVLKIADLSHLTICYTFEGVTKSE